MKVYVDEVPKDCFECPCFEGIETPAFCPCRLDFIENDKVQNYHKFDECNDNICPLKSLSEHDNQVRKEVCEKIRKFAYDTFKEFGCFDEVDLEHILDQIQGESNVKD